MDNFMDKLAQKFNAQDVIHANSEAETAELMRLKTQVAEYEKILQEMRKLNYKNVELSERIDAVISDKTSEISDVQSTQRELLATMQSIVEEQTRNMENALANAPKEDERVNEELFEQTKKTLEEISSLLKASDEYTHKESVKVYRNVQAVVLEEINKQTQILSETIEQAERKSNFAAIISILTFILVGADIALQIMIRLGIL